MTRSIIARPLNAVRWDLNGDGARDSSTSLDDWSKYKAAFPKSGGGNVGCELTNDLDFDTDGDGATYTGTGASETSDSGDDCHNAGAGWDPIGGSYSAVFKGNGYVAYPTCS